MDTSTLPTDYLTGYFSGLVAGQIDGRVVIPSDPDWDESRTGWQLGVDQRPVAIVRARSAGDVVATVRAAVTTGVRVAPQATGHNALPLGPLTDTVLLRTSDMRGVEIDPERRIARVAAGAVWGEVTEAAAAHGLAGLMGTARDVGVVGYTLGGGLSWFARAHGLAADQVTAAEIVTADGELRRVDEHHDPDLFWAIRGGGGSFGVVTALEFRLFPIVDVQGGALFWPLEQAGEVLHAWCDWLPEVPDSVTSLGRLLRIPPLPDFPEAFRGRAFVVVEVVSLMDATATERLLHRFRELGPEIDTVGTLPVTEIGALHMDPPVPVPAVADGLALREFSAEALDAYLATVGPQTTHLPLLTTEIRHLGGAVELGSVAGGAVSGSTRQWSSSPGPSRPTPSRPPRRTRPSTRCMRRSRPGRRRRPTRTSSNAPAPACSLLPPWSGCRR